MRLVRALCRDSRFWRSLHSFSIILICLKIFSWTAELVEEDFNLFNKSLSLYSISFLSCKLIWSDDGSDIGGSSVVKLGWFSVWSFCTLGVASRKWNEEGGVELREAERMCSAPFCAKNTLRGGRCGTACWVTPQGADGCCRFICCGRTTWGTKPIGGCCWGGFLTSGTGCTGKGTGCLCM